jgi:hypothetical protein
MDTATVQTPLPTIEETLLLAIRSFFQRLQHPDPVSWITALVMLGVAAAFWPATIEALGDGDNESIRHDSSNDQHLSVVDKEILYRPKEEEQDDGMEDDPRTMNPPTDPTLSVQVSRTLYALRKEYKREFDFVFFLVEMGSRFLWDTFTCCSRPVLYLCTASGNSSDDPANSMSPCIKLLDIAREILTTSPDVVPADGKSWVMSYALVSPPVVVQQPPSPPSDVPPKKRRGMRLLWRPRSAKPVSANTSKGSIKKATGSMLSRLRQRGMSSQDSVQRTEANSDDCISLVGSLNDLPLEVTTMTKKRMPEQIPDYDKSPDTCCGALESTGGEGLGGTIHATHATGEEFSPMLNIGSNDQDLCYYDCIRYIPFWESQVAKLCYGNVVCAILFRSTMFLGVLLLVLATQMALIVSQWLVRYLEEEESSQKIGDILQRAIRAREAALATYVKKNRFQLGFSKSSRQIRSAVQDSQALVTWNQVRAGMRNHTGSFHGKFLEHSQTNRLVRDQAWQQFQNNSHDLVRAMVSHSSAMVRDTARSLFNSERVSI